MNKPYDVVVVWFGATAVRWFASGKDEKVGDIAKTLFATLDEAGLKIVPKKATANMIRAGVVGDPLSCDVDLEDFVTVYGRIWEAMLEAADK